MITGHMRMPMYFADNLVSWDLVSIFHSVIISHCIIIIYNYIPCFTSYYLNVFFSGSC